MANVKTGGLMAAKNNNNSVAKKAPNMFSLAIKNESVVNRFTTIFNGDKQKAEKYLGSALALVNSDPALLKCDPQSLLAGVGQAALLNLPLNKSYGCAYLIPYGNKAQFIVGYKGYLRQMMNTNLYKSIVIQPVYEGEIENWNRFTETYETGTKKSDALVGFFARFELQNGFAKAIYVTKEEVDAHAKKFSKGGFGWKDHYEAMGMKTAFLKIVKFAPMTEETLAILEAERKIYEQMQQGKNGEDFIDAFDVESLLEDVPETETPAVDIETGEIIG